MIFRVGAADVFFLAVEKQRIIFEIASIGFERVAARTAFRRHHVEKQLDVAARTLSRPRFTLHRPVFSG